MKASTKTNSYNDTQLVHSKIVFLHKNKNNCSYINVTDKFTLVLNYETILGDEMFSDTYKMKLVDEVLYEVYGKVRISLSLYIIDKLL